MPASRPRYGQAVSPNETQAPEKICPKVEPAVETPSLKEPSSKAKPSINKKASKKRASKPESAGELPASKKRRLEADSGAKKPASKKRSSKPQPKAEIADIKKHHEERALETMRAARNSYLCSTGKGPGTLFTYVCPRCAWNDASTSRNVMNEEELITHGRTIHWISDDEIEDYCASAKYQERSLLPNTGLGGPVSEHQDDIDSPKRAPAMHPLAQDVRDIAFAAECEEELAGLQERAPAWLEEIFPEQANLLVRPSLLALDKIPGERVDAMVEDWMGKKGGVAKIPIVSKVPDAPKFWEFGDLVDIPSSEANEGD